VRSAERKANGMCYNCDAPSEPGKIRCAVHLAEVAASTMARHRRLRGDPPIKKCKKCPMPAEERCAAHRSKEQGERVRRKEQGLCRACKKKRLKDSIYCKAHRDRQRQAMRDFVARKKAARMAADGR
jgi:hypothetical protein